MAMHGKGTFAMAWSQAELDGLIGMHPGAMSVGSTWRWSGEAVRVDDSRDILVLEGAVGIADMRRRAVGHVRRLLGDPQLFFRNSLETGPEEPLFRSGFEVTDGIEKFQATLVELDDGRHPMLLFIGALPPCEQDLWVVSVSLGAVKSLPEDELGGTICFVPGTRINTPDGARLVETLAEDDLICTKDNGVQPVRWIGSREVSGGRMIAMPHLRPVRLNANVLAEGEPDGDLIVSPDHRVLVKGAVALDLFNTHEVLVSASDLINDHSIQVDYRCRGVRYIHLLLDQHQIVWANGVEVESFHPAGMQPANMNPAQRENMLERFPDIREDAFRYGEFARRNLTRSEAAILSYGALSGH